MHKDNSEYTGAVSQTNKTEKHRQLNHHMIMTYRAQNVWEDRK